MTVFDPIDIAPLTGAQMTPERSEYLGRAANQGRIRAAFVLPFVAAAFLLGRGFQLQVAYGSRFAAVAERNRTRAEILVPKRAIIEDRNGVPLVRNVPRYAIGIVPIDIPRGEKEEAKVDEIATAIGVARSAITDALRQYPRQLTDAVAVRDNIKYDDAVRAFVAARELPAVRLLVEESRDYRLAGGRDLESLSHTIGFVGRISTAEYAHSRITANGSDRPTNQRYRASDMVGKAGIEAAFEARLRGVAGVRMVNIDARGRRVENTMAEPPIAGQPVRITIDRAMQAAAEQSLRRGLRAVGARRGAAIVLDPNSGELLGLVSLPAFSGTAFARGLSESEFRELIENPDHPLFPRAIAGTYPSGSTIKPMIAAAALSIGVIEGQTRLLSIGGIAVEGSFFPDWRERGHGWVDVRTAIAQSVNTFFYLIGGGKPRTASPSMSGPSQEQALGPAGIERGLRAFGFGRPTGIDIAGEAAGLVPTPIWKKQTRGEPWYIGDTYHLAIGQGDLLITPLQLAVATAAFANGGQLIRPQLFKSQKTAPRIAEITNEAITVVRQGMRLAVTDGSARGLADLPLYVAGKTGTAQHVAGKRPHAWFTGFAERTAVNRQPPIVSDRIVVTVLIEEGGEGSAVAVPVAREILSEWMRR